MMVRITSLQNGRIKHVAKLNQRRYRDAQQLTLVEGVREVQQALAGGVVPQEAFICPDLLPEEARKTLAHLHALAEEGLTQLFEVTTAVFAKIAYRGNSGGLLLTIPYLPANLENLPQPACPLFAIIEGAEKPGNVGAVLRTADGAGIDGIIVSSDGPSTDLHSPNVIRASLGALFSVPTAVAGNTAILHWLQQRELQIVAATPEAATLYTAVNLAQPTAIVAGSEASGLSPFWQEHADCHVRIPMHGRADSLNLSISVALLLYEALRQRSS